MGEYLLGYDVGSSSIKATLLETSAGKAVASAVSPERELPVPAPKPGQAEQAPAFRRDWINYAESVKNKLTILSNLKLLLTKKRLDLLLK